MNKAPKILLLLISIIFFCAGCTVDPKDMDNAQLVNIVLPSPTAALTEESRPTATPEPLIPSDNGPNIDFGTVEIYVFDMGKADAILIITENHTVMIDTGEDIHGREIVDYLSSRNIMVIIINFLRRWKLQGSNAMY